MMGTNGCNSGATFSVSDLAHISLTPVLSR